MQLIHRLKGERMENTYKAWVLSSRQQLRCKLASGITFDPILVCVEMNQLIIVLYRFEEILPTKNQPTKQ